MSPKAPRRSRTAGRPPSPTPDLACPENQWTDRPSVGDHLWVSTQLDAGGWRVLAPFKIRDYRLLVAAVALSIFATGMWTVVMALQVIALSNDPAALSLVAACMAV